MRIQEGLNNCCAQVKQGFHNAVEFMGRVFSTVGNKLSEIMRKIAELAKAHYPNVKNFFTQNKVIIGTSAAVGALILSALAIFGKKAADEKDAKVAGQPAPADAKKVAETPSGASKLAHV